MSFGRFFSTLFNLAIAVIIVIAAGYYWAMHIYQTPQPIAHNEVYFTVKKGEGLTTVSRNLEAQNLIEYPDVFKLFAYYHDLHTKIKAGEYLFQDQISPQEVLEKIVSGKTVKHHITLVEGHTVHHFLEKIRQNKILTGDITQIPTEGLMMPETYSFERQMDRDELIELITKNQITYLMAQWKNRVQGLPLKSPKEALILASIVEKETGIASERDIVASVFINRLNKGMRLQSDPTIIYGITKGEYVLKRPIYRSDIKDSQDGYNTYVIDHLPPTPICNPSKKAIQAVLNPAKTDYIYFVADGTGGHAFARTLAEHNDNVKRWRVIEKKSKQQKAL